MQKIKVEHETYTYITIGEENDFKITISSDFKRISIASVSGGMTIEKTKIRDFIAILEEAAKELGTP